MSDDPTQPSTPYEHHVLTKLGVLEKRLNYLVQLFDGITSIAAWLRKLYRPYADRTADREIGGSYDSEKHSLRMLAGHQLQLSPEVLQGLVSAVSAQLLSVAAPVAAQQAKGCLTMTQGDTWERRITDLGDLSNATEILVAIKRDVKSEEVMVLLTSADDTVTVVTDEAGVVIVRLPSNRTRDIQAGKWVYVVKVLAPDNDHTPVPSGSIEVQVGGIAKVTGDSDG